MTEISQCTHIPDSLGIPPRMPYDLCCNGDEKATFQTRAIDWTDKALWLRMALGWQSVGKCLIGILRFLGARRLRQPLSRQSEWASQLTFPPGYFLLSAALLHTCTWWHEAAEGAGAGSLRREGREETKTLSSPRSQRSFRSLCFSSSRKWLPSCNAHR